MFANKHVRDVIECPLHGELYWDCHGRHDDEFRPLKSGSLLDHCRDDWIFSRLMDALARGSYMVVEDEPCEMCGAPRSLNMHNQWLCRVCLASTGIDTTIVPGTNVCSAP